jgi:hypothetical protein
MNMIDGRRLRNSVACLLAHVRSEPDLQIIDESFDAMIMPVKAYLHNSKICVTKALADRDMVWAYHP